MKYLLFKARKYNKRYQEYIPYHLFILRAINTSWRSMSELTISKIGISNYKPTQTAAAVFI